MKTYKTYSSAELSALTIGDLVRIYNAYALGLGATLVKKFRDKPTAIKRVLQIQDAPTAEEPVAKPAKKSAKKETEKTEDEPRNFKLGDIYPKAGTSHDCLVSCINEEPISEEALAVNFINVYSLEYKGNKEVDISFAKGYISGALRRGYIVQV